MQIPQDSSTALLRQVKRIETNDLMLQARALEASFLSEMLAHAGFGAARESFGGGIGEEQFSSFLRDAEAKQMVARGGIGLAEQLFRSMAKDK